MKDDWAKFLGEARVLSEPVPKEWKTIWQLRDKYYSGMSVKHVRDMINPLLGKGVERKKFRIIVNGGTVRMVYHYKLK